MKHRNALLTIFIAGMYFVSYAWQEQRALTSDYQLRVSSETYCHDRAFQAHEPYRFSIGPRGPDRADIKRAQHFARLKARRQQHAMQQQRPSLPSYKTQEPESVDQHYAAAHDVFDDRCAQPHLVETATWRASHPARFAAYEKALTERGKTTTHCYQLSPTVCTALHDHGISSDPYYQLHGNALQHELLCETIAGIEQLNGLHRPPKSSFHELLYDHAFITFDDARFANEMGDCMSSAQLIDCAVAIKDCLYAAVAGAVTGAVDGAHNAVVGTYHMIRHPIEAVHALNNLGAIFAGYAHEYLPLEILNEDLSPTDWELHAQRCEEVSRKWCEAADNFKRQWRDTPTPQLLYQASYAVGNVSANVLVGNACLGMISKTACWAKNGLKHGVIALLARVSESEHIVATPGCILVKQANNTAVMIENCATLETARELSLPNALSSGKCKEYPLNDKAMLVTPIAELIKTVQCRCPAYSQCIEAKGITEMFMDEHALRHIFEAEVATYVSKSGKSKTKLHGFHLDYKDEIQTLGIFQLTDVKTFESGAVEANVWYKGIQIAEDKTFFPPTWTREKVLETIIECFRSPIKIELQQDRWIIYGATTEGLKIKLVLESSGKMVTAYPYTKLK